MIDEIMPSLSTNIRDILGKVPKDLLDKVEEIRLRAQKPLALTFSKKIYFISESGRPANFDNAYIVTQRDIENTLQLISNYSIYAFEDELKNGFITIKGGHRVGLVGKVLLEGNIVRTQKHITNLNIRITRELKGISDGIIRYLIGEDNLVKNTLIISPPKCGKTTLLRDIARNISLMGINIGIVDERSEIAGCYNGIAQRDVGPNTDVLDACPKAIGIMMMIRSMSPSVIITDEIGSLDDIRSIEECLKAGISLITSIHGFNLDDIVTRPYIKELIKYKTFDRYIVLSQELGTGTIEEILDRSFNSILSGPFKLIDKKSMGVRD